MNKALIDVHYQHNNQRTLHSSAEGFDLGVQEKRPTVFPEIPSIPLFGEIELAKETTDHPLPEIDDLPDTSLSWALVGTFIEDHDDLSSAIIDIGSQQQARYYVGEKIDNEVHLRSITLGNIVIERNGELERLSLYQEMTSDQREVVRRARRVVRKTRQKGSKHENIPKNNRTPELVRVSANYKTLSERLASRQSRSN
ncbi:MAG: type II secretion system protein N [Pseudomonadota bacterium]